MAIMIVGLNNKEDDEGYKTQVGYTKQKKSQAMSRKPTDRRGRRLYTSIEGRWNITATKKGKEMRGCQALGAPRSESHPNRGIVQRSSVE